MLKYLTPSLAMLAAIPAAQAYDIMGDGWEMSIEPRIQSRVEFGATSDAAGDDTDPWNGGMTDNARSINFYLRRARIYFTGKSEGGWKWNYTIMTDKVGIGGDVDDDGDVDDRDNDAIETRYAYIGKTIKSGDIKHYIQFGLDKHTSSVAETDSSSKLLFPNGRYAAAFSGPRSIGIDYSLSAPLFSVDAGLADSWGDDNNDYYFYARVATPLFADWKLPKRSESYLGEPGTGHELGLGFDLGIDGSDAGDAGGQGGSEDDGRMVINLDYLIHWNQVTALLDFAYLDQDTAGDGVTGMAWNVQAGYAVPLENGKVVEPAARIGMIDSNDDEDSTDILVGEGGGDGMYIDLGVNYYLDGHKNKLQAGIQLFTPEEDDGDGFMFRLAHQLDF